MNKRFLTLFLLFFIITNLYSAENKYLTGIEISYIEKAYEKIKNNKFELHDYNYQIKYQKDTVLIYIFLSKEKQKQLNITYRGEDICIEMNLDGTNIHIIRIEDDFDLDY